MKYLLIPYNATLLFLDFFFRILAALYPKYRDIITPRLQSQPPGSAKRNGFLFFCSSAGEFEQAKPLIDRLFAKGIPSHVIFFSESGKRFLLSRNERVSFSMAPIDRPSYWREFFAGLSPRGVFVVKHELWPNFLQVAKENAPLMLVNAIKPHRPKRFAFARRFLLNYFNEIFCCLNNDESFFRTLGIKPSTHVVGDTKFDRVIERLESFSSESAKLQSQLKSLMPNHKMFILGSGWPADIKMVFSAFSLLMRKTPEPWCLIIVPHNLSPNHLELVETLCRGLEIPYRRFTDLPTNQSIPDKDKHFVLLVDQLGKLAELYGCADIAMVGGGIHHRVHNILEPAAYGLPICCGPKYHSQAEAIEFVNAKLLTIVRTSDDLADWWTKNYKRDDALRKNIKNAVYQRAGAAHKIWNFLTEKQLI